MMRKAVILAVMLGAIVGTPIPAAAWGLEVHKFIMARAIPLLPPEIRPFFQKYQASIVEHAIDPDLWRTVGWLEEPPRHFLDMDAYGPYPFKICRTCMTTRSSDTAGVLQKNGTLPWRSRRSTGNSSRRSAAGSYARENIKCLRR